MKVTSRVIAAAAAAGFATAAFAGSDEKSLSVSASVAAVCKLTLSGGMAFGALDPTLTSDAKLSVTASYQCTKGTAVTSFTVNGGTLGSYDGLMTGTATGEKLKYNIAWTNPTAFTGDGMGASGTTKTVTLNGKVANADYVLAAPDSYSGSVPIAVNY